MAHIVDGILSAEVSVITGVIVATGTAYALKTLDHQDIPKIALMSAVFLIASSLRIPLPGTSAHLLLGGLMGLMLGWQVFPALLVAMVLQLAFFGFGGVTSLGANVMNIAVPALFTGTLARIALSRSSSDKLMPSLIGFALGLSSVAFIGICLAGTLALSGQEFLPTAKLVLASHGIIMLIEGLVTASALSLLLTLRPQTLRLACPEPRSLPS